MIDFVFHVLAESWRLLVDSSVYVLMGIVVGGLLKVTLSPGFVARHLGQGRVLPVVKAGLLGIPLPLCSCGVLPAAASLKRQGANNGATTSFLISTPESGVDSIAISYALLDPIMTLARPVAGFAAATVAGVTENLIAPPRSEAAARPDLSCPVDGCCDGEDCAPDVHRRHHSLGEKLLAGARFAFRDMWGDLASWFLVGILLAGIITAAVPESVMTEALGGGVSSMLLMLVVGIPLYICATASTPIAAALILKGVSPGAALVFLLAGPATNITSLTVLGGLLGKRATAVYLASIAVVAVGAGLTVDAIYGALGFSAAAVVGQAGELVPDALGWIAAVALLALSVQPVAKSVTGRWRAFAARRRRAPAATPPAEAAASACGCSGST